MLTTSSIRNIYPSLTGNDDFLLFWKETLFQLNAIAVDVNIKEEKQIHDGMIYKALTFRSLDNAVIHGYLLTAQGAESNPLVVYTHGYMGHCEVIESWAEQGFSVFGIDIRGFGQSKDAVSELSQHGYVLTGIESQDTSILRGGLCDYIRGIQVASELLQNQQKSTILYGMSFGGALASMASALTDYADLLVAAVPTFAWAEGRRDLVTQGSGIEINRYIEKFPAQEKPVMQVLSYFDIMNFAPLIQCDSMIGVGLKDPVVPAETVYAFINHLPKAPIVREFPVSHTSLPEERLWNDFEKEWLQLALNYSH